MPVFQLDDSNRFPPVQLAEPDGLLAVGGDLSTPRLLAAYRQGIFPWYDSGPVLWYSPDPRFVLYPTEIYISKTMRQLLRRQAFTFTVNRAFADVIRHCRDTPRAGQQGTWITPAVAEAFIRMHHAGHAHSAEAWIGDELAGGLYGVRMGRVFFGESMFSLRSNASKYAYIRYVQQLQQEGVELVDCQMYTAHLESLGAGMISRSAFCASLDALIPDH